MNEDNLNNGQNNGTTDKPSEPSEILTLRKERDEYLAGWQRAKADFINYKRDESQRIADVVHYQMEDMIHEVVSVLDNFDLGLAALEKQGPVERGIYMIRTQLEDVLKRRGLVRIPAKPGDAFDPAVHEAIAETESAVHPPGSIEEVIEAGYKFNEKILRPVRVKVVKQK